MYSYSYSSGLDAGTSLLVLVLTLAAAILVGYIFGRMTSNIAAKKSLPHKYFWTGFFLGLTGIIYVGFLAMNTKSGNES